MVNKTKTDLDSLNDIDTEHLANNWLSCCRPLSPFVGHNFKYFNEGDG